MLDAGVLFVQVAVAVAVMIVLGGLAHRALTAPRLQGSARSARRRATAATMLAALAAAAFVVLSSWPEGGEIRMATMPALAATAGVIIAGLGELTYPRPHGERREASVIVRRGTAVRGLGPLFVAGLGASVLLLLIGVVTAGPTGRSLERHLPTQRVYAGPYPGLPYAVPIGLALVVLALATWWGLRRVDARPALGPGLEEVDRAIRIAGRVRVLRLATAGSLATAAGVSFVMGASLARLVQIVRMHLEGAPQPPWDWTQNAAFALLGLGVVLGFASIRALMAASPRVPAPEPLERVEAAAVPE
jgi:hypothetical protein